MTSAVSETMTASARLSYLRSVYGSRCAVLPELGALFFFYLDRAWHLWQDAPRPALLGLAQGLGPLTQQFTNYDVYRAVADSYGRTAGVQWSGRKYGDAYHLMCFDGVGGSCAPAHEGHWHDRHVAAPLRSNMTMFVYPYGRDARSQQKPQTVPLTGYSSHSRVEVFHCAERAPDEAEDFWM